MKGRHTRYCGAARLMATVLLAIVLPGCGSRSLFDGTPASGGDSMAFVGVTVIPLALGDERLADHTVLIRGDRISDIGPRSATRIPAGATRVDATGRFLMPGLADMHVHLEHTADTAILAMFLASGVTTVRSMDGRPYILEWRGRIERGELVGPAVHSAGPLLDGDPPLRPDNTVVRTPDEARAAVLAQQAAGYDFIKLYTNLSREVHREVIAAARERGMPVAGHVPRTLTLDEMFASGQDSIEHLGDYDDAIESGDSPFRGRFVWFKRFRGMAADPAKIAAVAERQARSATWTVPTLVQADREVARPEQVRAWLMAPEMAYMPADARSFWQEQLQRTTARMDDDDWAYVARGRANRLAVVRALHGAGVRLLAGTDTPNPFVVPGISLTEELVSLTEAGLTPAAALAASTREAARFLGQMDEWGTVERGKRADLLLLDADPLENVAHVRKIAGLMVRGRWLARRELTAMLRPLKSASSGS